MLEATGSATQFFSKVEFWQAIEKGTSRFLLQVGKLYKSSCKNAYSHPSDVIILGALHQNSPKQSGAVGPLKKEKGRKEKESNRRKQTRRKRKRKHAGMFPQFLGGWIHCLLLSLFASACTSIRPPRALVSS